jgi:hypothetical protein
MVGDLADKRETLSRLSFQPRKALRAILSLPGLVIFAADDEHVTFLVARESHVVIGHGPNFPVFLLCSLRCIPEQRVLKGRITHKPIAYVAYGACFE